MGEGTEAGLVGEPTWACAINADSGNQQRSKAEAQLSCGFYRSAVFPQGLTAVVRQETWGKRQQGLRGIATRCPARLLALTIPGSKTGQAR